MTVTMKETRRELLKNLNPHLLCVLCAGYYIDPTTIVECLHSFCRSCIVKYLEISRFCPICDVQLHKTKPLLSIRRDKILERLVYKIVPGLYGKEMSRRNSPREELYLSPDDLVSLVLQYHMEDNSSQAPNEEEIQHVTNKDKIMAAHRKYLKCPAAVTVEHLKKFLILKYSLTDEHQVDIFHSSECLPDDLSLIDVAYCFEWKQTSPMELHFQILQKSTVAVPIVEEVESVKDVDIDDDSHSVASSLPFMSSKSFSECDDASNTSLDSKPLIERLESERAHQKRKRSQETSDDEPEEKKSLFDCLLQSTTNNNIENEDKDFQESDEDYSKYEQDIEEIIEEDDDDDTDRLQITTNLSEDELVNHDETPSQMFVIDEAIEEEKYEKVAKEKHWKSEGRTKKKSKKAKHHHHHHKRKISQSPPPTATIVHSPDRDIMKLKVKLNTLPGYRHKDEKYHKHNKHSNGSVSSASSIVSSPSRSSYKEDDSVLSEQSCDSAAAVKNPREDVKFVADKSDGEIRKSQMSQVAGDFSHKSESLFKESTQHTQRCPVRPKPKQSVEQQLNAEQSHNNVRIMPPSSITVSIITAEEKLKMEKDKTLMLTGNHDFENKRPSLEIVRVNGPPASPPARVTVDSSKTSPNTSEQHEEPLAPRPKTKKPVPAVIPLKSTKPSITITPQNGKSHGSSHTNGGSKLDEMKTSITISLENGFQNDSALDLSGKSSRKDGVQPNHQTVVNNNKACTSPHPNSSVQYEQPSGIRNLMTLSDTAVHLRNMMSSSCKDPHQQKPQQQYQQHQQQQQQQHQHQDLKKRFGNNHVINNNGSCSPKRANGSVPLRIPVPPTSVSFSKTSPAAPSSNKSVKVTLASSRTSDVKPKHGPPNQGVRHIPNPSVLLFRHHQQHLAQFAVAAAASAAAVVNSNNNNNNMINTKRPNPMHVAASRIPAMPAAIPLHTIRKMENMTKNIEKVAAGLSVKANALYKQNFIENGRARLELPS